MLRFPQHVRFKPWQSGEWQVVSGLLQKTHLGIAICGICVIQCGCQSGVIGPDGKFVWNQQQRQAAELAQESAQTLQVDQLNSDNESLHAQLAQARQQYRITAKELELTKTQLQQTTEKLAGQSSPENTPVPLIATTKKLTLVDIEGVIIGRDGDTVRIEVPAASIFSPGGTTISSAGETLLDRITNSITTHYAQQLVTIEGHAYSGVSTEEHHLRATQQSLSIYRFFQAQRLLPDQQFVITSRGSSKPRYSTASEQGRTANQRIEFIIHPTQY